MASTLRASRATLSFRPTAQRLEKQAIKTKTPPAGTRSIATTPSLSTAQVTEYNELQGLFDSLPFVTKGPKIQPEEEFKFPTSTLFKAATPDIGLNMAPAYARALKKHGVAAIELDIDDPDSQFILNVVDNLGCKVDTHSSTQGALWDVTYHPSGVKSDGNGKSAHSVSHSLGEFNWHTDAAFGKEPMRFFGFHILHPDKESGGVFRLLRSDDLAKLLSPETINVVPDEFFKGEHKVKGKLLRHDPLTGALHVRYRADILQDPPPDDPEIKQLLQDTESVGKNMPTFAFNENMVLLMDNARFMHSRTNIKDPQRWLRRVRFRGNPGESVGKPKEAGVNA